MRIIEIKGERIASIQWPVWLVERMLPSSTVSTLADTATQLVSQHACDLHVTCM